MSIAKVGLWIGLTDVETSELNVGAFGFVVMGCYCWEGAACFVDLGNCRYFTFEVWFV